VDERLKFGKELAYRVGRTGDRDLQFTGKLIGHGRYDKDTYSHYESLIYQTKGGKYIAARRHWRTIGSTDEPTEKAEVCETPESVAQFFFMTPAVPAQKRGAPLATAAPYLCEDGKKALEKAAGYVDDFRNLFMEEIE
jgi:hypothetical protein